MADGDGLKIDATDEFVTPGLFNCQDHLYSRELRSAKPGRGIAAIREQLKASAGVIKIMALGGLSHFPLEDSDEVERSAAVMVGSSSATSCPTSPPRSSSSPPSRWPR